MKSFCVKAHAKINLFLHIIGKNSGYHLIESLFIFSNFSNFLEIIVDEKHFKYDSSIVEFINSELKINKKNNTIIKTINLLLRYAPSRTKVIVKVIKNVPISSGLGSGSSDAAAVIRVLGKLWNIDRSILNEIAFSVGADVPASIDNKPVLVKGVGKNLHTIEKLSLPKNIVLIKPKKKFLSTPEVYSKYRKNEFSKPIEWNNDLGTDFIKFLKETKNDLQETAISLVPEIEDIITSLKSQKGSILSRMSGSGVACFGLFDNKSNAKIAVEKIKEKKPDWWIQYTQLII